ncbi:MAG: methylenetetrahydrofolate reductase [Salinivirgaceae bacterium]|nr:methylenetetrahydrofolate reductase [Salinivirgaceae bacterium]MBR3568670.1 methylenetetrahydrofolate reductase [Salinivirgaceae bacterium]MBR4620773.1 methylenetetrahydrofolate reductase [Salinivirgaceae bacterium]
MLATLKERILNRESGFLFYGLTPPKASTGDERVREIADKQMARVRSLNVDALILYDLQDESSRNANPRPFPFSETIKPDVYSRNYLTDLQLPKIIYKSVGKYSPAEFANWVRTADNDLSVFVGSPSKSQTDSLTLSNAYRIKNEQNVQMVLGGVTIPERHHLKGDEHLRLFSKIDNGCRFFVSQCVYSVNHTLDFLSDYYYTALEQQRPMVPVIFTLTPCGSTKSLEFLDWLGIDVPHWLHNDLQHSENILHRSVDVCSSIAAEIVDFCRAKSIPMGFNIESVAIRKEEIEASIELVGNVRALLNR